MSENSFKYASDNIKLVLGFKQWTQAVLCKKTGITLVTLQRRLRENSGWSLTEAVTIAKAFNLSVNELFFTRMIPNGNTEQNNTEKGA
jgi:DNA-binding XRE family transcriptional regulator